MQKNRDVKEANRYFENVAPLKCLEMTVTNQILIQEEIKRSLNSGNNYYSVQNLLSACLLPKNARIRTYKTIVLPVVLYGCEIWALNVKGRTQTEGV
jgi:hypothetical protein